MQRCGPMKAVLATGELQQLVRLCRPGCINARFMHNVIRMQ